MPQPLVMITGASSDIGKALAAIVLFCWKQRQSICIRDRVVAPTRTIF